MYSAFFFPRDLELMFLQTGGVLNFSDVWQGGCPLLESSRLEFSLEQLIMVHMLEGHPPCQNGQIGQISSCKCFLFIQFQISARV